jgi:putative transposase
LRRPVELRQYTSADYTQVLDDHQLLASIGTVGDALDNALAESFVDSYKTELIADRVWRSRAQLELATVEYVAWFNHDRLHESLGDIPPVEFEALHATRTELMTTKSANGSVVALAPRAADGLTTSRVSTLGVDFGANSPISAVSALDAPAESAQAATTAVKRQSVACGLSDLRVRDILTDKNIKTNNTNDQEPT